MVWVVQARKMCMSVLSGKIIINNAKSFAEFANKIVEKIETIFVGNTTYELHFAKVEKVPETLKIRHIQHLADGKHITLTFLNATAMSVLVLLHTTLNRVQAMKMLYNMFLAYQDLSW